MSIFENAFELLADDATEVDAINKRKAKMAIRALNAPVVKDVVPKKKEEKKKEEPKKKEETPATGAVIPTEPAKKQEKVIKPKQTGSDELPQKEGKLSIVRSSDRKDGEAVVRPGKREFDRHSGTGRGKEQRKDGAGKANWGKEKDGKAALVSETQAKEEAKEEAKKDETTPAAEKKEEAKKEGEEAPKEEEKEGKSLKEYIKEQQKALAAMPQFPTGKAVEIHDDSTITGVAVQAAPVKEEASVPVPAKKDEKKTEKKAEKKVEKVDIRIRFNDEAARRAERQTRGKFRGQREEGATFVPKKREYPKKEVAAAPKPAVAVQPTPEAFPALKK